MNQKNIKIGLGETVITPTENIQMFGFARSQVATGVHDELHSRCLIVEDTDGNRIVLLSVSICELLFRETADKVREAVSKVSGVAKESIMLSNTHTHAGPDVENAPIEYKEYFVSQIAKSAKQAMQNLAPGRIGVGSTVQLEVGKNRRRLLYGGLHPDPELIIIKIEDLSGKLRGILFNYGCHPATLDWRNTLYSEDWPYYAIKGIKEEVGKDIWVCYLQAAEGNINTGYNSLLSAIGAYMPVRDYSYIEYKGKQMAETVINFFPNIETEANLKVQAIDEYHNLTLRKEFPVTIEEAEKHLAEVQKKLNELEKRSEYEGTKTLDKLRTQVFSATQTLNLAKEFHLGKLPQNESTEIQAFRIGETVFFSLPGEIFSEIALAIKKQSPFKNSLPVGLTNGYYAYMPTKEEFIDGDYEVDGSKYSPEAGDELVKATVNVIKKLSS